MKTLLVFVAFCISVHTNAQIRSSFSGINQSTKLVIEKPISKQRRNIVNTEKKGKDYELYRNIVRKYTWFVGQGEPITQEVANRLPFYYRLSMKNDQGNWQHVEAMHGDTLTTHHDQSTYLFNKNFDKDYINGEWYDKINSISQWFITSDISGNYVVEERAYTNNGDMIYSFIPVQNDSAHITGSYNDAWGRPVDMNEKDEYTFGDVIYITYDINGCDSIINYFDGAGLSKRNTNGVDQERITYDNKGRITSRTSHNCVGDYMIDNWGNCGNIYEYSTDNKSYTIMRVDQYLNPIRMPQNRANSYQTYIKCQVVLDEWGREKERIMITPENNNDSTLSGIHRIVYKYSDNGMVISETLYDINNNEIQ